ncbi:unnamed protein product, partial [marine sediment metagenome]
MATVAALPAEGYIFVEWWEDGVPISLDNPISLVMDEDRNVTALFEEVPVVTHTLTIGVAGQGTTDPLPGSWSFLDGELAVVTAIPSAGWLFNHWEGDISGSANPVIISMITDMSIIAVFSEEVPPEQYALDISVVGEGTTEPPPGTYLIDAGTGAIIIAVPSDGWRFDHWEGDISGTDAHITVVMHQHTSAVAVFTEKPLFKLEDWLPQEPSQGPPFPEFLGIFWPWYTPPGAEFRVSNLVISPTEVNPGQTITITCTVTNIGAEAGSYTVKMRGDFMAEQSVTLQPGESK